MFGELHMPDTFTMDNQGAQKNCESSTIEALFRSQGKILTMLSIPMCLR